MILLAENKRAQSPSPAKLWDQFYAASHMPKGFTVLDPFLGGGTTLIEAVKQGADCIGVDIDPVACFITQMELAAIAPAKIEERYKQIDARLRKRLGHFYKSTRGRAKVDVVHYFWVDSVDCSACRTKTDAHPTYQLVHDIARKSQTIVCPCCDQVSETRLSARWHTCKCGHRADLKAPPVAKGVFTCPSCKSRESIAELSITKRITQRLFAIEYLTKDGERGFQRATHRDIARYRRAARLLREMQAQLPIPRARIPVHGRSDRRPIIFGHRRYVDLFNARQLLGLGVIAKEIMNTKDRDVRRALALAFSHALASNNMFCGWAFGYRRLTPLFGVHAFRKVTRPVEANLLGLGAGRGSFGNAVRAVVRGYEYMVAPFEYTYRRNKPKRVDVSGASAATRRHARILNRSSTNLSVLRPDSVDLVLTDPPYFDNLSYSELSDFYHVWLRRILKKHYVGNLSPHTPIGESLFGGRRRGPRQTRDPKRQYVATLTQVFRECRRVVRQDGALVFTFHHRATDAWESLGTAILGTGFQIERVVPVRSEGQSGFHSYDGTLKWDAIFFCRPVVRRPTLVPDLRVVANVRSRVSDLARRWMRRIRRSHLAFSSADQASLEMALALGEFSRRSLSVPFLGDVLKNIGDSAEAEKLPSGAEETERCP